MSLLNTETKSGESSLSCLELIGGLQLGLALAADGDIAVNATILDALERFLRSVAGVRENHWRGTGIRCEDVIGGRLRSGFPSVVVTAVVPIGPVLRLLNSTLPMRHGGSCA